MFTKKVMITGGLGLIGAGLSEALQQAKIETVIFDVRGNRSDHAFGDIMDVDALHTRVAGCEGIVHLAAISRVAAGERNPIECWTRNVTGTDNVLKAALAQPRDRRPWVVCASSREVYGSPEHVPVGEDSPLAPVNIYGRSKVATETLSNEARSAGLVTAIARFANVYGSVHDYPDRVVPAFARAAASGTEIRIQGAGHTFDFTWIRDVAEGLVRLCEVIAAETSKIPPIHFATGRGTTLGELALIARSAGRSETMIEHDAPRDFDVDQFVGDPTRARQLLGWSASTSLETGVSRLVDAFSAITANQQSLAASA